MFLKVNESQNCKWGFSDKFSFMIQDQDSIPPKRPFQFVYISFKLKLTLANSHQFQGKAYRLHTNYNATLMDSRQFNTSTVSYSYQIKGPETPPKPDPEQYRGYLYQTRLPADLERSTCQGLNWPVCVNRVQVHQEGGLGVGGGVGCGWEGHFGGWVSGH